MVKMSDRELVCRSDVVRGRKDMKRMLRKGGSEL